MRRYQLYFILAFFVIVPLACVYFVIGYIPARASLLYGPPARSLSLSDRIEYSTRLLSHGDILITPYIPNGIEMPFDVEQGESVLSITDRLEEASIISNGQAMYDYLVYTGLDLTIQAGTYKISPALSIIDITKELQDSTPADVTLTILSGWRMEEIAASLPTSGLTISPEEFIQAAQSAPQVLSFVPASASMEGFFLPDSYVVLRVITTQELLDTIARNFALHITDDLRAGFSAQGLDIYQAVTLASLVEREAVHEEEQKLIASVFINRLNIGMNLGADPTIQYALGYDPINLTWWKNPLSLTNLQFDSPYNTYIYPGLPPGPIASPSLEALQAVAFPQASPYYYFQANCDRSGYHNFAVTFEEHIDNSCP